MTKEEKDEQLKDLKEELQELKERKNVLDNGENEDEYDEMLNEQGDIKIGSLTYAPAYVLHEVDPTAYNCGLSDFNDEELSNLEDEIKEKEVEITELEAEEVE